MFYHFWDEFYICHDSIPLIYQKANSFSVLQRSAVSFTFAISTA
jgi:hypothetical protein